MTWYLARSSGIVAYFFLAASMLWGLWLSTRTPSRRGRAWVLDVHKSLGALGVLFTAGHLAALLADSYVDFDVTDVLVPLASPWQPLAVAWGVLALYLLVAVQVTSMLRRSLSRHHWRTVHLASFGAYLLATGHFLTAGTDAGSRLLLGLAGAVFGMVAVGTCYRLVLALSSGTGHAAPVPPTPRKDPSPWPPPSPPAATRPLVSAAAPSASVLPASPPSAPSPAGSPPRPPMTTPPPPPPTPVRS